MLGKNDLIAEIEDSEYLREKLEVERGELYAALEVCIMAMEALIDIAPHNEMTQRIIDNAIVAVDVGKRLL